MGPLLRQIVRILSSIGADPSDPVELRFRKALLVAVALMVLPASIVWGALYWSVGERTAALLPWAYAAGSLGSLAVFQVTRDFRLLRGAQLLLILWVPRSSGSRWADWRHRAA